MRYVFPFLAAVLLFSACDNGTGTEALANNKPLSAEPVSYTWSPTPRDSTITPETSWSDLFLDSSIVENFIATQNVSDTAATALRHFYNRRNYGYAWLNTQGLTEQGKGLWNRTLKSAPKANSAAASTGLLDSLLMKDTVGISATDTLVRATELKLTLKFIDLWNAELRYNTAFALNDPMVYVPAKREDPIKMADALTAATVDSMQVADSSNEQDPQQQYILLKQQLKRYLDNSKTGGLLPVTSMPVSGKKGIVANEDARALRQHLYLHGFIGEADTARLSADSMRLAVKRAQASFSQDTTGLFGDSLKAALNQPLPDRIAQILVNMNRLLWIEPVDTANSITVNIPEFLLRVYEGGDTVFTMPVIVGKEGAATLQFGGSMNMIVFNPYWNIPQSIARNEILPASKKDPGYLKRQRIEQTGGSATTPIYRQLPGPDNSLGLVKFLFPNNYDIYLHDTPVKDGFKRNVRAMSHGCIRLSDATRLAQYILRNDPSWSAEKVRSQMDGKEEKKVSLKNAVPVRITYLTASVAAGQLKFFNDVYRLDQKQYRSMFRMNTSTAAQPAAAVDTLSVARPL